jgi:hypothetical protein
MRPPKFKTRKRGRWTDVVFLSLEGPMVPVMVTSFGGSDCGRREARRYAKKLNEAVDAFYEEQ